MTRDAVLDDRRPWWDLPLVGICRGEEGVGWDLSSKWNTSYIRTVLDSMSESTTIPTIDTGVSEADRKRIAEGLARLLADTSTLYFKTHGYHWNVVGPSFAALHKLFEEQYTELHASTDEIAERVRALGFWAPGSYRQLAALSSVPEADEVPDAPDMVHDLALGHEQIGRSIRELLTVAESLNDYPTIDLLSGRLAFHEKAAWMLRSTLA